MIESQPMLTLWRRHTAKCPHRDKGREHDKCPGVDTRRNCAQPGCETKVDAGRCSRHTREIATAIAAFH